MNEEAKRRIAEFKSRERGGFITLHIPDDVDAVLTDFDEFHLEVNRVQCDLRQLLIDTAPLLPRNEEGLAIREGLRSAVMALNAALAKAK